MRILMVGAGSVAVVLTRFLEAVKSNEVTYYVRAGRKKELARIKLVDAKSGEIHVREKPAAVEPESVPLHYDLVLFAVRDDQLEGAIAVAAAVPGAPPIATVTQGLARLRERLPGRPIVQIAPMFLAWRDGDVVRWWNPPLARTLISGEGDAMSQKLAEELAASLKAGGLQSRATQSLAATKLLKPLLQVASRTPFLPEEVRRELRRRLT